MRGFIKGEHEDCAGSKVSMRTVRARSWMGSILSSSLGPRQDQHLCTLGQQQRQRPIVTRLTIRQIDLPRPSHSGHELVEDLRLKKRIAPT